MKKLFFAFFLTMSFVSIYASIYEVHINGFIYNEDGIPSEGVLLTYIDNSPDSVHITTITNAEGFFELVFETSQDGSCGKLFFQNCNGVAIGEMICYSPTDNQFHFEWNLCHNPNPCFDDLHIDVIPKDDSLFHLILALAENIDFTVVWSTGDTGIDIIARSGVEYCVTITSTNCTYTKCITPGNNGDCEVNIYEEFGIEGGLYLFASANANDHQILEYQWNNGSHDPFIMVLDSGEYCVKVKYVDGCIAEECIVVNPDSIWNNQCWAYIYEGINDTGGRFLGVESLWSGDILEYEWSTGETTESIYPDSSGIYSVTVITNTGCVATAEFNFLADGECDVVIYEEFLWNDAELYAYARGAEPFEYTWSDGTSEPFIHVFQSGKYCVTVTDASGCVTRDCISVHLDSIDCNNSYIYIEEYTTASGKVALEVFGSFGHDVPIEWNTGEVGNLIYPTERGEYCVKVQLRDDCILTACHIYNNENCKVDVVEVQHKGTTYIYPLPYGIPPFTYEWNTGSIDDYLTILESGEYCLSMTDATGCQSKWCGYIKIEDDRFCEAYISVVSGPDGAIYYQVHAIGEAPFSYRWDNDQLSGDSVTINEPGVYCVTVTDARGCEISTCVEVGHPHDCSVSIDYTVGVAGDTILIADVYAFGKYEIIWDNGDTGHEITYPGYSVCVIVISENGCQARACFDGAPEDPNIYTISGIVIDTLSTTIVNPDITVYRITQDSVVEEIDAEITIFENNFRARVAHSGSYLVRVAADGYIPTYYRSAALWNMADWIYLDDATVAVVSEIYMISEDNVNGSGIVSGQVGIGDNVRMEIGTNRTTEPYIGAEILITDMNGNPLFATFTGDAGEFLIDGLLPGNYRVILEIPGYPQQVIEIEITEDNLKIRDLYFEFNIEGADSTSGIEDVNERLEWKLYPNPVNDLLSIRLINGDLNGDVRVSIADSKGKVVFSRIIDFQSLNTPLAIDLKDIAGTGLYHLSLISNRGIYSKRFVKID